MNSQEAKSYIDENKTIIEKRSSSKRDGFLEEQAGINYEKKGMYEKAILEYIIAIRKNYISINLYEHACALFRKYDLYQEEVDLINLYTDKMKVDYDTAMSLVKRLSVLYPKINKQMRENQR